MPSAQSEGVFRWIQIDDIPSYFTNPTVVCQCFGSFYFGEAMVRERGAFFGLRFVRTKKGPAFGGSYKEVNPF